MHTLPAQATDDKELLQCDQKDKKETEEKNDADDLIMNADMLDVPTFLRKHE